MKGKIVVVTGGNSGIGKATAMGLAKQGAVVVLVCRDAHKGEQAREDIIQKSNNKEIYVELCDFSSQASIHQSGQAFQAKYPKVDVLINNAGAIFGSRQLSVDGLEMTFAVNHIGYFLWTHYLLKSVENSAMKRIVNVASLAHKFVLGGVPWDDLQYEHLKYRQFATYGLSKLCNIYFTRQLALLLQKRGSKITVNCLHPGTIATNFGVSGSRILSFLISWVKPFLKSTDTGAKTSIYLATSADVQGITGEYFDNCKKIKTTKLGQDLQATAKMWDISMKLTNLEEYGF